MKTKLLPILSLTLLLVFNLASPMKAAESDADTENWYLFQGDAHAEGSLVMLGEDWLPRPAGANGRVEMRGDKLFIANEPVKFWGINDNFGATTPKKDVADKRSKFYSRLGFNLVRLHKAGNPSALMDASRSITVFKPDALDRFDYYTHRLREEGVFYSFSLQFKTDVGPEDLEKIPAAEEIFKITTKNGQKRVQGNAYGLMYVSEELQDLLIAQLVNLLEHENPYSKMTHAENPALAYVEIINEDNLYFYHALNRIKSSPYYKKRFAEMFSDWLQQKYGTQEKLEEAWGKQAFNALDEEWNFPGESLAERNIFPVAGPWNLEPEELKGPLKQRTLDAALFYRDVQDKFYAKASEAIRGAGFEGPLVGSNWISRSTIGELHNLYSDAQVGFIDRHNYHTGQVSRHWQPVKGEFNNTSMMPQPGGSLLSSGYLQVLDRPFMLSEWIHAFPNEWAVEGPALISAYGLGLQGWDLSTIFSQSGNANFSPNMHSSKWDSAKPNIAVLMPALARQLYRGDITEAEPLAPIHVTPEQIAAGDVPLELEIAEDWDVKSYDSQRIPTEALAIGRVGVSFSEGETPEIDPATHQQSGKIISTTNQLSWTPGDGPRSGYVTIDAGATRAVLGFLPNEPLELSGLTITPASEYAAIYVTALDPDANAGDPDSTRFLVTAVARARNKEMQIEWPEGDGLPVMKDFGSKNEVLMEPVKAAIQVTDGPTIKSVTLLDHSGVPTEKTLSVSDNAFTINGARDKTMYYLLEFNG